MFRLYKVGDCVFEFDASYFDDEPKNPVMAPPAVSAHGNEIFSPSDVPTNFGPACVYATGNAVPPVISTPDSQKTKLGKIRKTRRTKRNGQERSLSESKVERTFNDLDDWEIQNRLAPIWIPFLLTPVDEYQPPTDVDYFLVQRSKGS